MNTRVSPEDVSQLPESVASVADEDGSLSKVLVAIRRHLHRYPEIGMREHETSKFIRETLEGYGLDVKGPIAGTGLFVDIEGEAPGETVAYRADIDALPTRDQKTVPYRSTKPNAAHLCGHDAHTAVGIGVALLLDVNRDRIEGTVRVFFQPNEEGLPSGAPLMIRSGVMKNVGGIYGIHVDPTLEVGRYGLRVGAVTASSDRFDVYVRQDGTGHSARPHESTDTVWVANQIMNQYYQLAGRITDARDAAVLTICTFEGSEAHNVIPEVAHFGGTLRTVEPSERERIRDHMRRVAQNLGSTYGADVTLDIEDGAPPVLNDGTLIDNVGETIRDVFDEQAIYSIPKTSMGGEDFAHYLKHAPGAFVRVGTASGPDTRYPLHHHKFNIDETPLAPTAQLMSHVLVNHLSHNLSRLAHEAATASTENGTA